MEYLVSFLEGIITFVSPCILPMIPIYLAYFAGDAGTGVATAGADGEVATSGDAPANGFAEASTTTESAGLLSKTLVNALGFVLGFTIVFVILGAFAGTVGALLTTYQTAFNIVCGLIVVVFGLNFMGVLNIGLLNKTIKADSSVRPVGFFSSALFGLVFAAGWTPCVGAFLGSALLLAAQQGSMLVGITMLVCYSLGLGIPFVLSAVLVKQLESAFNVIKRHYRVVNLVCGGLLVVVGVLMATGLMGRALSLLSF
ncbi:cytochrome c biogenesis CcdA family protein [Adlercreutzia sp. ZJ138]|uniref:cytochrome c biogenesis CcdA family protein n=1 Tax=Adlercreutzia sp. ZJ138 TaxID=2709405 RepID=UPI0013EC1F05|nr:cytochrome c biogenesis protein CcdA [Adlercreutzia sp. ZJ138]